MKDFDNALFNFDLVFSDVYFFSNFSHESFSISPKKRSRSDGLFTETVIALFELIAF